MPRTDQKNQLIKDARRTEILRAASRVFAKKGFAAAKINDIAHEAKLSHGLVYHYYRTKDDVFAAILEDKLEHMRVAMAEDDNEQGSAVERMHASITRWLAKTQEEPEMGLMIAQALLSDSLTPAIRDMLSEHAKVTFEESVKRLRLGQRRGEIGKHASAEELATSVMCLMRGLALTTLVPHGVAFSPPSAATVMRLLVGQEECTPSSAPKATSKAQAKPTKTATKAPAKTATKAASTKGTKAPRKATKS
jgi:AcrR family transcriptional regulator